MKTRRIVGFILSLVFMCSLVPVVSHANETVQSQEVKVDNHKEKLVVDTLFGSVKNLEQGREVLSKIDLTSQSVDVLNKLLGKVDLIQGFSKNDVALLKSDIIRGSGFTNFNWKGLGEEVKAFTDMKLEIKELKQPMELYRRGYPGEPDSPYGLGRWWGDKYRTVEEVRNDLAVLEAWGNPLQGEYKIIAPAGIRIVTGKTAPQQFIDAKGQVVESRKGGAVQYWLNDIPKEWIVE